MYEKICTYFLTQKGQKPQIQCGNAIFGVSESGIIAESSTFSTAIYRKHTLSNVLTYICRCGMIFICFNNYLHRVFEKYSTFFVFLRGVFPLHSTINENMRGVFPLLKLQGCKWVKEAENGCYRALYGVCKVHKVWKVRQVYHAYQVFKVRIWEKVVLFFLDKKKGKKFRTRMKNFGTQMKNFGTRMKNFGTRMKADKSRFTQIFSIVKSKSVGGYIYG